MTDSNIIGFVNELPHSYQKSKELGSEKTRKHYQNLKVSWRGSLVPSVPSRCNNLVIAAWSLRLSTVQLMSCYTAIHTSAQKLCEDICNTISKIHVLTWYNATSKVGTKVVDIKIN